MSEAFTSFGQNFRTLFSSLLAFSSSITAVATLLLNQFDNVDDYILYSYKVSICSFFLTILIAIVASYIGLYHEVNEGKSTKSLNQRNINQKNSKLLPLLSCHFASASCHFYLCFFYFPTNRRSRYKTGHNYFAD